MKNKNEYLKRMNYYLRRFVIDALWLSLFRPKRALFLLSVFINQWKAARRRSELEKQNIKVPPYMIISITDKCNLKCRGCYAHANNSKRTSELTSGEWERLLNEACELGVSVVFVGGGEPLIKPEFFDTLKSLPSILFPVFTNGLLIDSSYIERFVKYQNVIPVVSVEGLEEMTDKRRGDGVFFRLTAALLKLDAAKIFYGLSITVTRKNFDTVTSDSFIRSFLKNGCSLFFFIEYIPVDDNSEGLVLTEEQRSAMHTLTDNFRVSYKALFVTFPGDEREYDGCLAAGRGFFHVAFDGSLEPCPFAPYSDTNIRGGPLKDALSSRLFDEIRKNHKQLEETGGGCALWNNRQWVRSLVDNQGRLDRSFQEL